MVLMELRRYGYVADGKKQIFMTDYGERGRLIEDNDSLWEAIQDCYTYGLPSFIKIETREIPSKCDPKLELRKDNLEHPSCRESSVPFKSRTSRSRSPSVSGDSSSHDAYSSQTLSKRNEVQSVSTDNVEKRLANLEKKLDKLVDILEKKI
ncbi:unnamed protein product [Toxocara canis]|uniref:Bro-N domain-containing protein n=1 Tax=Toxocara canis TaxID=6265 RepID=A0A183U338_TOXCA|nr:unnamed protein product [Toxocara canis]